MSKHSSQVVQKAMQWLSEQGSDWPKHIQDSNIAVQLYLKSRKTVKKDSSFQKELESFINSGAILKEPVKSPSLSFENQQNFLQRKEMDLVLKAPQDNSKSAFYLDEKSFQSVKQIQEEWNLESLSSALRLLIQTGHKNLNRLKN